MADYQHRSERKTRVIKPLSKAKLEEMALAYVARYATSAAKLERYLNRKLRERGWAEDAPPDLAALVSRYVRLGYIDDEAFARAKSGSLLRRGYGARRVNQALGQDGIDEAIREDIRPGEAAQRHAALALARKRRFGPFGNGAKASFKDGDERALREKQIAAMLRAGHSFDMARSVLNAPSQTAAQQWAEECDDDETDEFV